MAAQSDLAFSEAGLNWCMVGSLLLIAPTILGALESSLITHVLLQFPLLAGIGILIGGKYKSSFEPLLRIYNRNGVAGILLSTFALIFWMIPRWLDASLTDPWIGVAKYASLLFLVGVPLSWSWAALHPIARGVVKIEFLTMLFRLGWLYLISPERLCNSYLQVDQEYLGYGCLLVATALALTWLTPVFLGPGLFASEPGATPTP